MFLRKEESEFKSQSHPKRFARERGWVKFTILSFLITISAQAQEFSYAWNELVMSVKGNSSFEQRGSPDLMPFKAYVEIKDEPIQNGFIQVKIHFLKFIDTSSVYSIGTLDLFEKSAENDKRRDIYYFQNDSKEIFKEVKSTDWIRVKASGGIIITQATECGLFKEYGIFFYESSEINPQH